MRLTLAVALAVVSAALGEAAAPLTPDPPRSSTTPRYSPHEYIPAQIQIVGCEDSVTLVLRPQSLTPAPEMVGRSEPLPTAGRELGGGDSVLRGRGARRS